MRRHAKYEPIGLTHVGTVLAEAIGDADRIRAALGVWPAWEQAVGPQIAAAARPVSLKRGVLVVHVRHAVWMQELSASRETLLRRIQKVAGGSIVREMRFRVGELPPGAVAPPAPLPPPNLSAPIPYDLAATIRAVPSPELRTILLRVAARWAAQTSRST